jgi:tetratricopeptide (TPR) repeat protein
VSADAAKAAVEDGLEAATAGDWAAAEAHFGRADELGSGEGAFRYGVLLRKRGDRTAAVEAWRRGADRGHERSSLVLFRALWEVGDEAGAESVLRAADDRGSGDAAFHLGQLYARRAQREEGVAAFARAARRGSPEYAKSAEEVRQSNVAVRRAFELMLSGDLAAAIEMVRPAYEHGSGEAASVMGQILLRQGDDQEAEAAFRRAEAGSEEYGPIGLGLVFQRRGQFADAEVAFRRADGTGSAQGAAVLAKFLALRGDRWRACRLCAGRGARIRVPLDLKDANDDTKRPRVAPSRPHTSRRVARPTRPHPVVAWREQRQRRGGRGSVSAARWRRR